MIYLPITIAQIKERSPLQKKERSPFHAIYVMFESKYKRVRALIIWLSGTYGDIFI
ncbi:hypothetical protein [Microcoleus sp. Pol12A6]|uniref:hypothetical protein n=1 Tax=Microcoleus sp. Pol12A6 TaxID=3055393 RepID=UPI002FD0D166